jgi:hypothetical protein
LTLRNFVSGLRFRIWQSTVQNTKNALVQRDGVFYRGISHPGCTGGNGLEFHTRRPRECHVEKNAMSRKCALAFPKRPPHDGCTVNGNSSRSVLLSLSRQRGAGLFDHRPDERELPCDWPDDAALCMSRE